MATNAHFKLAKYHTLHDCHTFAKKNMLSCSERKMPRNLKVIDNGQIFLAMLGNLGRFAYLLNFFD